MKEARTERLCTMWFHLYELPEEAKLVYDGKYQNSGCLCYKKVGNAW